MNVTPLDNQAYLQAQAKLIGFANFVHFKLQEPMYLPRFHIPETQTEPTIAPRERQFSFLSTDETTNTSCESPSLDSDELQMESQVATPITTPSLPDRAKEVQLPLGSLAINNLQTLWKEHRQLYTDIIDSRQRSSARQASRALLGKIIGAPVGHRGYKTLTFLMQTAVEHQSRGMPDRQRYITMIEELLKKGKA